MKKIFALIFCAVFCFSCMMTGCTGSAGADVPADGEEITGLGIANPMKYYDTAKDVEDAVGIYLNVPAEAADVSYLTISGVTAQSDFTLDGKEFTLRASNSLSGTALHGIYGEQTSSEERNFDNGVTVTLSRLSESYYIAEWEKDGSFFSLSHASDSDDVLVNFFELAAVVEKIIAE